MNPTIEQLEAAIAAANEKKVPTNWMITGWVCDCIIDEILAEESRR